LCQRRFLKNREATSPYGHQCDGSTPVPDFTGDART
jgi:hypothetical protein